MARPPFNFQDQLRVGEVGEAEYSKAFAHFGWKKSKDRKYDFVLGDEDSDIKPKTLEIKTDTYRMEKTPNFFMEQLTVTNKSAILGGPWRSKEHKADYFVYFFLSNRTMFWFSPVPLCEFLDKYIAENSLRPISIPNVDRFGGSYEAQGFKIPRDSVKHLVLKEHAV